MPHQRTHIYEVRPAIGGPPVLSAPVDRQAGVLNVRLASGATVTLDAVDARALWIVIHEAVYERRSLSPIGPTLTLTWDRGSGRAVVMRQDAR